MSDPKKQSNLLLPDEKIIMSKAAEANIQLLDYGKKEMAIDNLMGKQEKIGGVLHLTNYRLVFQSHTINEVTGTLTIFFNTIKDIDDISQWFAKKMEIVTRSQRFEFILWGVTKLIREVQISLSEVDQGVWLKVKEDLKGNKKEEINEQSNPLEISSWLNVHDFDDDLTNFRRGML